MPIRRAFRRSILALALSPLACGDVASGTQSSDAGSTANARDAHADTASRDATSADVVRPDGGTGCDAGAAGVACLAVAGPIYANGAITVDDASVYWVEHGQIPAQDIIVKVPRSGGAVVTLAHASAGALAADGTNLYFTMPSQGSGGSVMAVPVSGGTPTKLASATYPHCLALDDTSVYWTDPAGTGSVVKVAKTGGAPTVLVPAIQTVPDNMYGLSLVVDATNVYWLDRSLFKVNKEGGTAVTLVSETGANFFDYTCRALVPAGDELIASLVGDDSSTIVAIPSQGTRARRRSRTSS